MEKSPLAYSGFILCPFRTVEYNTYNNPTTSPTPTPLLISLYFKCSNYHFIYSNTKFLCVSHSHLQTVFLLYLYPKIKFCTKRVSKITVPLKEMLLSFTIGTFQLTMTSSAETCINTLHCMKRNKNEGKISQWRLPIVCAKKFDD